MMNDEFSIMYFFIEWTNFDGRDSGGLILILVGPTSKLDFEKSLRVVFVHLKNNCESSFDGKT